MGDATLQVGWTQRGSEPGGEATIAGCWKRPLLWIGATARQGTHGG